MTLLLASLIMFILGGLISPLAVRARTSPLGPGVAVVGALLAASSAVQVLGDGRSWEITQAWQVPLGALHLGMDALSALFVLLIAVVGAAAAIYGHGYLAGHGSTRKVALSWCWYNLLMAAMLLVVVARDGFLFLVAWEAMSLTSFFLVVYESGKASVIKAGWIYLIATHVGTAFLLAMFLLLGRNGQLDFSAMTASGPTASVVFLLALVGFGTKAGLVPMHIWLPEAHPAAPSHVSALMSGVMIKTGIYGILRTIAFLDDTQMWWGWTLVGVGAASGILGVLIALAQHDLKRLLAYHSVENIGIISLGLGIGLMGICTGNSLLATLGLSGGLLHVINHGLFKSLLFFGAGSVLNASGTREIDRLGGLMKRMPVTAAAFIIGAAAICGLPPFNGFISEFMIYTAAFTGVSTATLIWSGLLVIVSLSLIAGLAAICFTKVCGIIFLGEARTREAQTAVEAPITMRGPMILLAALCVAVGIAAPFMLKLISPAVAQLLPASLNVGTHSLVQSLAFRISLVALILIGLTAVIAAVRTQLLTNRTVRTSVTWDCGYAAPSARMQYTASSFIQPVMVMFRLALRSRKELDAPKGYFPQPGNLRTHTPDIFVESIYAPTLKLLSLVAVRFRHFTVGRTHQYILYIVLTLVVLLIWNMWRGGTP